MRRLYDFEKNIAFCRSDRTFEIVELTQLYGLTKAYDVWVCSAFLVAQKKWTDADFQTDIVFCFSNRTFEIVELTQACGLTKAWDDGLLGLFGRAGKVTKTLCSYWKRNRWWKKLRKLLFGTEFGRVPVPWRQQGKARKGALNVLTAKSVRIQMFGNAMFSFQGSFLVLQVSASKVSSSCFERDQAITTKGVPRAFMTWRPFIPRQCPMRLAFSGMAAAVMLEIKVVPW